MAQGRTLRNAESQSGYISVSILAQISDGSTVDRRCVGMISDVGSKLRLDNRYTTNNDDLHGRRNREAAKHLRVGWHPTPCLSHRHGLFRKKFLFGQVYWCQNLPSQIEHGSMEA